MPPSWQILIPHMPHRHAKLVALLDALGAQMAPGVEVIVYTDNLELPYREKLQTLYDAAAADYVSSLGNDDMVAPNFVERIQGALAQRPDYVGFRVHYTEAGRVMPPVVHSLSCGGWSDTPSGYFRDLMYYNPIRRELAERVRFRGDYCDVEWADDLRALGCVQTEVFVDEALLLYRRDPADNFHTRREPMAPDEIPPLPEYPFVRHLAHLAT